MDRVRCLVHVHRFFATEKHATTKETQENTTFLIKHIVYYNLPIHWII